VINIKCMCIVLILTADKNKDPLKKSEVLTQLLSKSTREMSFWFPPNSRPSLRPWLWYS